MKTIESIVRRTLLLVAMALLPLTSTFAYTEYDMQNLAHFKLFRQLYDNGPDDEFYKAAEEYEDFLKSNGKQTEYFKIKCNEGFYDVDHHHLIRAMKTAELLTTEIEEAGLSEELGYLPVGLLGDVFKASRNVKRAMEYYRQALGLVGDRDPKYSQLKYMDMAELVYLKSPDEALEYANRALELAEKTDDIEFRAKALAMMGYIMFLNHNSEDFHQVYNRYEDLRSMEHPRFSHRYDNLMLTTRLAFDGNYAEAERIATTRILNVDRSLVLFTLYAMSGNVDKAFGAFTDRVAELDSIAGSIQELNLDDMATEMEMSKLKNEAENNKKLANRVIIILIVLTIIYLVVYIMGRRRLVLKIWARNKELTVARDKAEEADRMKSAFIRNMSHEIRTPLNAINGFSQLLCMPGYELSNEERQDMKERITASVNTITDIVNELLDMSKGESEVMKAEVKLLPVCQEVIATVQQKNIQGLDVQLVTDLSDDFTFMCHEENLKRILLQLMDNGLKFTKQGRVTLDCRLLGDKVTLAVTDTGIGIAEKDREQVFETFVKLDQYKEGVGLGLAVSRRLARLMGGDVVLDESYTGGSRFVLTLPKE